MVTVVVVAGVVFALIACKSPTGNDDSGNEAAGVITDPPNTVPVLRTGPATTYLAGDDGDVQAGRVRSADRFTAHGDGTIIDHMTGLMWKT